MLANIAAPDFDLEKTLNCGQVFHWEKSGAGFVGAIGNKAAYVEQRGDQLRFAGITAKAIADYFSLDHPLANICRSFPRDPVMTAARDFCQGLRIIRQPRWECLASFICSSMKQVAHRWLEPVAGRRITRAIVRVARRGRKGGELRHALRLRAAARVSDRRLDRARAQRAVFSQETKCDGISAS